MFNTKGVTKVWFSARGGGLFGTTVMLEWWLQLSKLPYLWKIDYNKRLSLIIILKMILSRKSNVISFIMKRSIVKG